MPGLAYAAIRFDIRFIKAFQIGDVIRPGAFRRPMLADHTYRAMLFITIILRYTGFHCSMRIRQIRDDMLYESSMVDLCCVQHAPHGYTVLRAPLAAMMTLVARRHDPPSRLSFISLPRFSRLLIPAPHFPFLAIDGHARTGISIHERSGYFGFIFHDDRFIDYYTTFSWRLYSPAAALIRGYFKPVS